MFSAATPVKKPHTRASAAVRRSQSRAASLAGAATPPPSVPSTSRLAVPATRRAGRGSISPAGSALGASTYAKSEYSASGIEDEPSEIDTLENNGILLKTETHAVSLYGSNVPAEVHSILSRSNFYTDPFYAQLDHEAGYACLVGREAGHVWSLSKTANFSPTCYTFPFPQASGISLAATVFSPVPFVKFVIQGVNAEPGFLVVSTTGQIRYWSSISAALSSVDSFTSTVISLAQGEVVRALEKISPSYYILATSGNRLYSLRLVSSVSTSQISLQVALVSRSKGMLARVGGLFGGASADPRAGILALTSGPEISQGRRSGSTRTLYAVSDRVLQQWRATEDSEQFIAENDLYDAMVESLYDALPAGSVTANALLPEILDSKLNGDRVLLLVSFLAGQNSAYQATNNRQQLSYALLQVQGAQTSCVKLLGFTQEPDLRPLSTPRLHVAESSSLAFVAFPDVILAVSVSPTLSFEESISLRDSGRDRILGVGVQSATSLSILAASSGLLQLDVNLEILAARVVPTNPMDQETQATKNLKLKLEQAVVFCDRRQNPLAFDLKVGTEGDLVTAAEAVSREILASSAPNLPNIIDLRAQLADRSARLKFLITFIQDNSLIHRLSKTARRHLAWDAEKLDAATGLWHTHNAKLGLDDNSVFYEAIEALNLPSSYGEEPVRSFFRTQIEKLGLLLEQLLPIVLRQLSAPSNLTTRTACVYQIAQILTTTYKTVLRSRIENGHLYGIPSSEAQICLSEPWSSRPKLLQLLITVFEFTGTVVRERTTELGSAIDNEETIEYGTSTSKDGRAKEDKELQKELKEYMAQLADYTLAMHQERMSYLQTRDDDANANAELRTLMDKYVKFRAHVAEALVSIGRINIAYDIAERYRDFRSLVKLCNDPIIGSHVRIQFYIEKYKEDFGFALYQWYLDNNRLEELMTQDQVYSNMLTKFLELKSIPRLVWMQYIELGKCQAASDALLLEAASESKLAEKRLMLSIGKLAKVSTLTKAQLESSEAALRDLERVDDSLDIVASHGRLLAACNSVLDARDTLRPVKDQAQACTDRLCGGLDGEQKELMRILFEQLLSGNSLSTEDLVDLFTLKNNTAGDHTSDYTYAIDVYVRDKTTPQSRLEVVISTIWRRIYLSDDWGLLRSSANMKSDDDFAALLRGTALYITMLALFSKDENATTLVRKPSEALYTGSVEEVDSLKARFSSYSYFNLLSVADLTETYIAESNNLTHLIDSDDVQLEQFYDEVQRLVGLDQQGLGAGEGDDTFMQE